MIAVNNLKWNNLQQPKKLTIAENNLRWKKLK
jgi:hypothetical protein